MRNPSINILVLKSAENNDNSLLKLINDNNYHAELTGDISYAIKKIIDQSIDLIISYDKVDTYEGYAVFKVLKKYIRNYGIPFFLVLDKFEKEDMLIGLEIGIDNFIVTPFNKDSVYFKIETQLSKRKDLNVFSSENFIEYFHLSSVAMFFVSDDKIDLVNHAFQKMNNGCTNEMMNLPLDRIFNLAENKLNKLNYRRFQSGITQRCKLYQVPSMKNSAFSFDISFYRGKNDGTGQVFAEILPSVFADFVDNQNRILETNKFLTPTETITDIPELGETEMVKLTERERQIFELSARGLPIKIIADKLRLSERTVEKHRANIMGKAKAKNMIEAIVRFKKYPDLNPFNAKLIVP